MTNDKPVPLSDADLDSVVGGVTNGNGITQIDLSGMDLETALMMVQSQRAEVLGGELSDQMKSIQERNSEIDALNQDRTALQSLHTLFDPGEGDDQEISFSTKIGDTTVGELLGALKSDLNVDANEDGMVSLAELKSSMAEAKREIDAISNAQQIDMLRLQSLTNKRNEAFEIMANFITKMQDSRANMIGNMR